MLCKMHDRMQSAAPFKPNTSRKTSTFRKWLKSHSYLRQFDASRRPSTERPVTRIGRRSFGFGFHQVDLTGDPSFITVFIKKY